MATFKFIARSRTRNSNEPLTYDIINNEKPAGTLIRKKNRWRLHWLGLSIDFDTKHQLQRHFGALGHRCEGLA